MIFARKMSEFYIIIAEKYFSPNFRGHVPPTLCSPVSYAYAMGEGTGENAEDGAVDQEQRVAVKQEHKERGDAGDDGRSVV